MDHARRDEFLRSVKSRLSAIYGQRLKGVVLFGSVARGDSGQDSDIDLLVLLDGNVQLAEDVHRINLALYPLQLDHVEPIHAHPVDSRDFDAAEYSFLRNAKREGLRA